MLAHHGVMSTHSSEFCIIEDAAPQRKLSSDQYLIYEDNVDIELKTAIKNIKEQLEIMSSCGASNEQYIEALEEVSADVDTFLEAAKEEK